MLPSPNPSSFHNPVMLWADVALNAQDMLLSSGSVIQIRTERMAKAGLTPSADDVAEFQLMSQEKLDAVSASQAAMARQMQGTQLALFRRALGQWVTGTSAMFSLAMSVTPTQFATHGTKLADAATGAAATLSQWSSAGAHVVQSGLGPLHAKVTANATRLTRSQA